MLKIKFFRPEDYWLLAVSFVAIVFIAIIFYAGTLQLRLVGLALGLPGLLFTTYIINRSYSRNRALLHLVICILLAAGLALVTHLLTN